MIRTVISLSEDDKRWLDAEAARQGVTMTELVRRAVGELRESAKEDKADFEALLDSVAGTWEHGDALEYQRKIRAEWEERLTRLHGPDRPSERDPDGD